MKPATAGLALTLSAVAPGCGIDTHWQHDPAFDFAQLKTYGWMGVRGAPSPLVAERVVVKTDRVLQQKGLVRSDEAPDFLIVVYFDSEVETTGRVTSGVQEPELPGSWGGTLPGIDVQSFRGGTMSFNFVTPEATPKERRLLWQGVAAGHTLSPRMSDEKREAMVDETVDALLSRFPPER